jgi:predicted TIM-barrel fold metal-dependent hydrolase
LVQDWKSLGVPFSQPDSAYIFAGSVLSRVALPESGPEPVRKAVLVPMAHIYGQTSFREALDLSASDEYARVRGENDHVAAQAALFPGRAVAFCSVDFLRPYALDEIGRCNRELSSAGVKLHLASAGADLRDEAHLGSLAAIAALAEASELALMVHLDPQQRGVEVNDIERFIEVVLQPYPDLIVIIAHLGGSGGYSAWTQSVLDTFASWLTAESASGRKRPSAFFDISAVWLARESEGVPRSTVADIAALKRDIERVGSNRILFGSDYPVFDPNDYAGALRSVLEMDSAKWEAMLNNDIARLWPVGNVEGEEASI